VAPYSATVSTFRLSKSDFILIRRSQNLPFSGTPTTLLLVRVTVTHFLARSHPSILRSSALHAAAGPVHYLSLAICEDWTLHSAFSTCSGPPITPLRAFTCRHPHPFPLGRGLDSSPTFGTFSSRSGVLHEPTTQPKKLRAESCAWR
jgi:hypothetical protein